MNFSEFFNKSPAVPVGRFDSGSMATLFLQVASLILYITPAMAQLPEPRFENMTSDDGLSANSVLSIIQDQQGYMWFGTEDGLNRYDGYDFDIFTHHPDKPRSLSDSMVWCIMEDDQGHIWVGTGNGLNRKSPTESDFTRYYADQNTGLGHNRVNTIFQDKDQRIWFGTHNGLSLYIPDQESFILFRNDPDDPASLSNNRVNAIIQDMEGRLWVGTYGGLDVFDENTKSFQHYPHDPENENSLSENRVRSLFEDKDGYLWIGTNSGGLNKLSPDRKVFRRYGVEPEKEGALANGRVFSIREGPDKRIWVATFGGGIYVLNKKTDQFERYSHSPIEPNSLIHDLTITMFEDRSGIFWIGTWMGLSKWNPASMRLGHVKKDPENPNSLSSNSVISFAEDSEGKLWIGTQNGLNRWDRESGKNQIVTSEGAAGPLLENEIFKLFFDKAGDLWVGTGGALLRRRQGATNFVLFPEDADEDELGEYTNIYNILEDSKGNLWVGSFGNGIWRWSADRISSLRIASDPNNPYGLADDFINTLIEDRQGWIWIGTRAGLQQWKPDDLDFIKWTNEPGNPNSLLHNEVICMTEDRRGFLWVGTPGGLSRLDRRTRQFRNYTKEQGLPNLSIQAIQEDNDGKIWISTNRGLARLDPSSGDTRSFQRSQLQGWQFNQGAVMKAADGSLFFGGTNGFNGFHPDRIKRNEIVPRIALRYFRKSNQRVDLPENWPRTENLGLTHKETVFSFDYSLLDYMDSSSNTYAYKMDGFNQDWVFAEAQRRATYTNLDPKTYTFRVKGANLDGVWSEPESVRIRIAPPPWRTFYAYCLYVLLLGLIIYAYLRTQRQKLDYERSVNERLRQIDRLKDEFLANTSHELRTPLNGIIGVTESLMDGAAGPINNQLSANLSMVVSSARRLSGLVDDILDFSKMKNKKLHLHKQPVSLCAVTDQVVNLVTTLAIGKELDLCNDIPPDFPFVDADENRVHQILHNLIGNAVKFTEKGAIRIEAAIDDLYAVIHVKDTGIGIPPEQMDRIFESFEQVDGSTAREFGGTGLGLAITRQLVSQHGGKIWASSSPGKGSTFSFTLPVSREDVLPETTPQQAITRLRPMVEEIVRQEPEQTPLEGKQFEVLVVDDDPINRQVLINHLSLRQYKVTQAAGGPEALSLFDEGNMFDLVLLDVMMPRISGYKVCRKLREKWSPSELPILLLTAKDQVEDLVMGFRSGANDYLVKPILKDELLARITTHLELLESSRNLENYKQHLEDKVTIRTADLEDRKRELEALDEIVQVINQEIHFQTLAQTLLDQAMLLFPQANMGSLVAFNRNTLHFEVVATNQYDASLIRNTEFSLEEVKGRYTNDHPLTEGIYLVRDTSHLPGGEKVEDSLHSKCMLTMSLMRGTELEGFFVMDNLSDEKAFDEVGVARLARFRQHAISAMSKARFVENLVETTEELRRTQQKLVTAAHQAGMAEIAINILHNIGNTLNSVKTSANIIIDHLTEPRAVRILEGVATLLEEHKGNLATFFTEDQRGRALPDGLARVSKKIKELYDKLRQETNLLIRGLEEIHQTLQMQQEHADAPRLLEEVDLNQLVRDVVTEREHDIEDGRIHFTMGDLILPPIRVEKQKLAKVLNQVMINAGDALMNKDEGEPRRLELKTSVGEGMAQIEISDNGPGIAPELLERIFQQGYTTKPHSRGHGLHFCANAMTEMGGRIRIESQGTGMGATCLIQIPTGD